MWSVASSVDQLVVTMAELWARMWAEKMVDASEQRMVGRLVVRWAD